MRKSASKKERGAVVNQERLEWMRLRTLAKRQGAAPNFWTAFHEIIRHGEPKITASHLDRAKALMRLHRLWF